MKPVLFVTGHVPGYRAGALARLHEREGIEVALFGGRHKHGGGADEPTLAFPHRHVRPRQLAALAASGEHRAVVVPTGGRLAAGATWAGARRARVPLILWASLWAHPRSVPHVFTYLALRRLYRSADAVVTYGPHVSAYVQARGARNVHVAPQSVDNDFWSAPAIESPNGSAWPAAARTRFLFVGRPAPEKGVGVLIDAWHQSGLMPPDAALLLVGVGSGASPDAAGAARGRAGAGAEAARDAIISLEAVGPEQLRSLYAAADVLVIPSIQTRTFREPWGLVANEAMNQGLAVIATDAVGAAAGGLVRDGQTGLVVPAGDSAALASAIERLADDASLRTRLAREGAQRVRAFSHEAWAEGFSQALGTLALSREGLLACVDQR